MDARMLIDYALTSLQMVLGWWPGARRRRVLRLIRYLTRRRSVRVGRLRSGTAPKVASTASPICSMPAAFARGR